MMTHSPVGAREALSTKSLEAMKGNTHALSRGDVNAAPHLFKLDSIELRERAVSRARLMMNLVGGRYSDSIASAVTETLRIGLAESPDERFNRELIERERAGRGY